MDGRTGKSNKTVCKTEMYRLDLQKERQIAETEEGATSQPSRQVGNLFSDEGKPIAVAGIE